MRKNTLDDEVISILFEYDFPGNIRELKNILERMMVLGPKEGIVTKAYLPQDLKDVSSKIYTSPKINEASTTQYHAEKGLTEELERIEKEILIQAMFDTNNNQVKAAELLKVKRATLQYKLKKYQIS